MNLSTSTMMLMAIAMVGGFALTTGEVDGGARILAVKNIVNMYLVENKDLTVEYRYKTSVIVFSLSVLHPCHCLSSLFYPCQSFFLPACPFSRPVLSPACPLSQSILYPCHCLSLSLLSPSVLLYLCLSFFIPFIVYPCLSLFIVCPSCMSLCLLCPHILSFLPFAHYSFFTPRFLPLLNLLASPFP